MDITENSTALWALLVAISVSGLVTVVLASDGKSRTMVGVLVFVTVTALFIVGSLFIDTFAS